MSVNTKELILAKATELFNVQGYGSVNMHDIAKSVDISRGNLAYHYKEKEAILFSIVEQMWAVFAESRNKTLIFPSFTNIEAELHTMYTIQQQYSFIFLDAHVLRIPFIRREFEQLAERSIEDFKRIIAFSIQLGNMKPETVPGMYHQLAFLSWMTGFYWLAQQQVWPNKKAEATKVIWSILIPHFTDKGIQALERHCQSKIEDMIGAAFQTSIYQLNTI